MRVLFIPSGDDKYGAPRSLMELAGTLAREHGVEPVVMTCTHGKINEWCERNGFEHHVLGQGSFMVVGGSNWYRKIVKHAMYPVLRAQYLRADRAARARIEELLADRQIDLVHTNVNRVDVGGYYALAHGIPHVWHLREFGREDYNCMSLRPDAISFMNRSTTRFIAISGAVKEAWARKGLEREKIEVIYNGVDFSRYPSVFPERERGAGGEIRIVFAGIISETKGQKQLVEAVAALPEQIRTRVRVDFYGGGREAYIRSLQREVSRKGLEQVISFRGYSNDLPALLPEYDIGVMASRSEAFGRVTAEYMAAGLCVLASDTGANPEIVEEGRTGLLFPLGRTDALAAHIAALAADTDRLDQMRRCAFDSVKNRYTIQRNAQEVYALYERVLAQRQEGERV